MGRLKEDPPPGTPSLGCPTPPTPPVPCPSCREPRPAGGLRGLGVAPPSPRGTSLGTREGDLGTKLSSISPRLGGGKSTVLSPHSLELILVPWLSGVTTPRAAPNSAHTNTSHVSAPTTPTARRGPSRLGCSTVTLMAIFAFPALLGAVIMLERADMLLPAMPISQQPSHCPIPTQTDPQELGAMDAFRGTMGAQG